MIKANYLFGTAGWSYRDWYGTVYPAKVPGGFNHLQYLGESMDFVEVNSSFYRVPTEKLTTGWVRKTEMLPGFGFWLKIHSQFTHERRISASDLHQFKAALVPLERASRLLGLLAQFPYSFKLNTGHLKYVLGLAGLFREYPLAIEFRHRGWNRPELFDLFRENRLIWVNIDQPLVSQSLPLTAEMTHDAITYFRLHGRNAGAWFSGEGRDARYDYDYSVEELKQIAEKIKTLAALAKHIFISGNNHYKGSAFRNLLELKKWL